MVPKTIEITVIGENKATLQIIKPVLKAFDITPTQALKQIKLNHLKHMLNQDGRDETTNEED